MEAEFSYQSICELIRDHESRNIEVKETTGQLDRAMETLCAFLNTEGGIVLFGVTDKGKVIGQEVADKTKRDISQAVRMIEPTAPVQICYVDVPDSKKKVIVLQALEDPMERPFVYKERPYYRLENTTRNMPQSEYNRLLMQRDEAQFRWENRPDENLSIEDLDTEEILKTVRLGIESGRLPESTGNDLPAILEKLNLVKKGKLIHAAAVLFAGKELPDYPQCLLRMARFKGNDKQLFVDNRQVRGNVFRQLDEGMQFFFKHLSLSGKVEFMEREEELSIPRIALRECLVNALCHRQYRTPGGSVAIAIYDNRVEIENVGAFPPDMSLEKLKSAHRSEPYNPVIAEVFYKRKLLESWGRGINLMITECTKAGLPEPEFRAEGNVVTVTFCFAGQAAGQVTGQVTGQVRKLLSAIGEETMSVKQMMEALSLGGRDNFLRRYLNPALEDGLITLRYPDQPRHPEQQYYLTDKGKALLRENKDK